MLDNLTIEQNGKNVSLCFMNNETFKKLVENRTETELIIIADKIYSSALKVLEDSNKSYGILARQMQKMQKDSIVYSLALKKQNKINTTIENINKQLDLLEDEESSEFCWLKYMITYCLGNINAIEDEE